jgi:hypothetical protein
VNDANPRGALVGRDDLGWRLATSGIPEEGAKAPVIRMRLLPPLGWLVADERSSAAIAAGEMFADAAVEKDALTAARKAANAAVREIARAAGNGSAREWAASAAEMVSHATYQDAYITAASRASTAIGVSGARAREEEQVAQWALLRDIFGNPFRPVAFDPSWRTEAVVGLARGMYESRDFGPMPVLADALEDAGCADAGVLTHCRGPGPHVRGCWVVDLVLGKA